MNYYLKPLKMYANFNGRTTRKGFWMFYLINFIILSVLKFFPPFDNYYFIAVFIPCASIVWRRMHDIGKSGWYGLIPIYQWILLCTNGNIGPNKYGHDPRENNLLNI